MLRNSIYSIFNYYFKGLHSGICLLCQDTVSSSFDLCKACERELPYLEYPCVQCALPLPSSSAQQICGACLTQKSLLPYRIFSPFLYQFPIDRLITTLKFRHQLNVASVLGYLMANKMEEIYQVRELPDIIIPIPLHKARLRERGFNQALELARPISQVLAIPVDYRSCTRIRSTHPQMNLPKEARAHNVRGAFAIAKHFYAKRVCIIDDVLTTGHTAIALSNILFKAGVQSIDIWCCARSSLKAPTTLKTFTD